MKSFIHSNTSIREIITQCSTKTGWAAKPEAGFTPFRLLLPDPVTGQIAIAPAAILRKGPLQGELLLR